MTQYIPPVSNIADWNDLTPFVQGYVEAAFFTECHADNPELEHAETGDIAPQSLKEVIEDCHQWWAANRGLLEAACDRNGYDETCAGNDYWFTRNSHGVGFWDRKELDADDLGDRLTTACEYSPVDLCRGDDGQVYFT